MAILVALLRAVNVGGTGKLAMSELRTLCERAGFSNISTYIQSGNVVFESSLSASRAKAALEQALERKTKKPVRVLIRSPKQLERIVEDNPFPKAPPNQVLVLFLDQAVPKGALDGIVAPGREELHAAGREIVVHYPDGMGRSKLKLPLADQGTGRNLNTVNKLIAMARALRG